MTKKPKPTPNNDPMAIDHRTRTGRRMKALVADLLSELGGVELNTVDMALVRLFAVTTVESEKLQAAAASGLPVDQNELVRIANVTTRVRRELNAIKTSRPDAKAHLSPLDRLLSDLEDDAA
jgi:hypothetical protein